MELFKEIYFSKMINNFMWKFIANKMSINENLPDKVGRKSDDKNKQTNRQKIVDLSTFGENIKSNISAIQETISDAGLFNANYENTLNIFDSINEQVENYNRLAKSSVSRDVYNLIINSLEFNELHETLANKIKSQTIPEYGNLISMPKTKVKLNSLDADPVNEMLINLVDNDKKAIKRYINIRNDLKSNLTDYLGSIDDFERKMVAYRKRLYDVAEKNIKTLVDIHSAYAWAIKNKYPLDEFESLNLHLCKSQKEFLEKNLKDLLNIPDEN